MIEPPQIKFTRDSLADGTQILAVCGELDGLLERMELTELLESYVTKRQHLILDLSGAEFVGSLGLSLIVRAHHHLLAVQRCMVILRPHRNVARVIKFAGLDGVVQVTSTVDAALATLRRFDEDRLSTDPTMKCINPSAWRRW